MFDAVPAWLAARSRAGKLVTGEGDAPPTWHWGLDADEERRLATLPGVASLAALRVPRGRGPVLGFAFPLLARAGWTRRRMFTSSRRSSPSPCRLCAGTPPPAGSVGSGW